MRRFFLKLLPIVLLLAQPTLALADLEWITGETPKATNEEPASTIVRDAPSEVNTALTPGAQDVIVSLMTTCTNIVNDYPEDSVNYFYLDKSTQISYYAYLLIKPTSRIHMATVECFSPSNICIAKFQQTFRVSFVDRLLTFQNETYQWFLVDMTLSMSHLNPQFGQIGLPRDVGLYTIRLYMDGQLVGISFFYVKPTNNNAITPVSTFSPMAHPPAGTPVPETSNLKGLLPMSTPLSKEPIPKSIQ